MSGGSDGHEPVESARLEVACGFAAIAALTLLTAGKDDLTEPGALTPAETVAVISEI